MESVVDLLFFLNVAWLLTHELDAIRQHEWRLFPGTQRFDNATGYRVFAAAHVPLLVVTLWLLPVREFQIGFDAFLIVHAGLHWQMRNHPKYDFNDRFSQALIFGVVPLAVLHLFVLHAPG